MFHILIFLRFVCLVYAAPAQAVVAAMVPAQEKLAQNSLAMLANEWVLPEHLVKEEGRVEPVKPFQPLRLVLYPNKTYQLIREQDPVFPPNKAETVEWGNWEINKNRGLISAQVTNVDGRSILCMMLYRWQIKKLTPQKLILHQYGYGNQIFILIVLPEKVAAQK